MLTSASSRLAVPFLSVAMLTLACGGDGSSAGTPYTPPVTTPPVSTNSLNIVVANNSFSPKTDTVAVGSTVVWTWTSTGTTPHSVQSLGAGATAFPSSAQLTGDGSVYSAGFTAPGTYPYDCAVHGVGMSGVIVVK
jgi:plastocyanin